MSRPDLTQLKTIIEPAKSILIVLPKNLTHDVVASSLGLKLALESVGKSVSVSSASPLTVEYNRLVGVDTISNQIGSSNLVISFDTQSELVDTVSYDLDKGELRLVITPKANAPKAIDHRHLKFIPGSSKSEVIITIGIDDPQDLGELYSQVKDQLSGSKSIGLHHIHPSSSFASSHFSHPDASSLSEFVTIIIDQFGYQLHEDVATNLYSGLVQSTNNFQSSKVSHETFEIAALLLRRGARRDKGISASDFPSGSIPGTTPKPVTGFGSDHHEPEMEITQSTTKPNVPPADWYEPKIYRGPMLQ